MVWQTVLDWPKRISIFQVVKMKIYTLELVWLVNNTGGVEVLLGSEDDEVVLETGRRAVTMHYTTHTSNELLLIPLLVPK